MLDRMRTSLNLFILFMFVVAIVYGIFIIIFNAFSRDNNINMNPITTENVDIYIKQENLLTTKYGTFYTLQNIVQDFITALNEKKTNEVYNILTDNLKAQIGSDRQKLVQYGEENFKYVITPGLDFEGYQNSDNLMQVYSIDDDNHICIVTSMNESRTTKIGIKFISREKYLISYIEI